MQLISASVPKRNAPSGVANGQNELLFSTVRERTEAQFSRFAGGKLALVSDPERFALFRGFALSPRALSLILEEDALPLFSLPEGVSCILAAGGEGVLIAARCFAEVRRIPCVLFPADASLRGVSEEEAYITLGGKGALHRLAPASVCCDKALLMPTLGEGYASLLLARLACFEGRALAAFGMGEPRSEVPAFEATFESVLRAAYVLPAALREGEGFTLAALLQKDGEKTPHWRAYVQLSALYAAFFEKGMPRRTFVPDYARRALSAGAPLCARVPSPEEYALRALTLERIRSSFAKEAKTLLEARERQAERISSLSAAPLSLRGGNTFRLRYLPEFAPRGLSSVIRDFGLLDLD